MIALRKSTVLADAHARAPHGSWNSQPSASPARVGRARSPNVSLVRSAHLRPRPVRLVRVGADLTGSDARDELAGAKTTDDVDAVLRRYMKSGDVPSFIKTDFWVWVPISGGGHTLELRVLGDYWGVGTNADYLRAGKTSEGFAQEVADHYDAILPSQKLLRDVEAQANTRVAFIPVQKGGGADDSIEAVFKANDLANTALEKIGATSTDGTLKIGFRKSYVVRPNLDGKYIAIYGGRWNTAGGLVQPTSGHAHTEGYSDYSHGLTLISRKAKLDGVDVDLRDLFLSKDGSIVALVSDEGSFDPKWPSVGSGGGGGTEHFGFGGGEGVSGGGSAIETYSASDSSLLASCFIRTFFHFLAFVSNTFSTGQPRLTRLSIVLPATPVILLHAAIVSVSPW